MVLQSPDPDKADAVPVAGDKMEGLVAGQPGRTDRQPLCLYLPLCLPDRDERGAAPGHLVSPGVPIPAGVPGLDGGQGNSLSGTPDPRDCRVVRVF